MHFYESFFKGFHSIVMENEELSAVIIPELGSKMASLKSKKTGREFLYQTAWESFKKPSYASNFESYDLSGFDEMFPTILECPYPNYPWKGVMLPDHGEVWSLPWEYSIQMDEINLWTYGVRMPYKLSKTLRFARHNVIRLEYTLENLTCMEMQYIWCAHILKGCTTDTEILFPSCVTRIMTTKAFSDRLGDYGAIHTWPATKDISGNVYELNKVNSRETGKCEKFYAYDRLTEGWCAIHHRDTDEVLGLSFPVLKIPYLGLWISEGGLNGHYHVALEPASGSFDRVDSASQWNRISKIKGKCKCGWYLNITIDRKKKINTITKLGMIE